MRDDQLKTIDARGQLCPKPLILTKKALLELGPGDAMTVLIDNETSRNNVERFLKDNGMEVGITEEKGVFRLAVIKTGDLLSSPAAEDYCETSPAPAGDPTRDARRNPAGDPSPAPARGRIGNHAFVFKKTRVAEDELGEILTVGFFSTIGELDLLPGRIIFYHEGVRLVLDDSPVLDHLKKLESLGVSIMICGTCVDHYKVKDRVGVGIVSNAYDILTAMSEAHHLVNP
jgi:selenium metabolism protein YedF